MAEGSREYLGRGVSVYISPDHGFGTDALLLADFAAGGAAGHSTVAGPVCDMGTGCGIIPLLLYRNGQKSDIYGIDIQPKAIEQFSRSLHENGDPSNMHAVLADIKELPDSVPKGTFKTVIMNPPYKPAGTGILSSSGADQIARHETECTISDAVGAAKRLLNFGGKLVMCSRPERLADVMEAFRLGSIEPKRLRFVQKRPDTKPWLFLLEGALGGKPYLTVEPPLFIQNEDGGNSKELTRIIGSYAESEETN